MSVPWAVRLRVLVSPDESVLGESRVVERGGSLVVGRRPADGVAIKDKALSKEHLRLSVGADLRIVVEDLQTKNGSRVDRTHLVGSIGCYGDAVIKSGSTVMHVGLSLPDAISERVVEDPLVRWMGEVLPEGPLMFESGPGAGVAALARRIHRRRERLGPLLDLPAGAWTPGPGEAETGARGGPSELLAGARGGTVLLRGAGILTPDEATEWLRVASERQVGLILQDQALDRAVRKLVPPAARIGIPSVGRRRAAVWGRTLAMLRRRLGPGPGFKPGAAAVWLWSDFPRGWETLTARIDRPCALVDADSDEIRATTVRRAL